MEDTNTHAVDDYIYDMEGDPGDSDTESPEAREARLFTALVTNRAAETIYLRDDIYDVTHDSTAKLSKLLEDREAAGISSVFLPHGVSIRKDVLARLSLIRPEPVGPCSPLMTLCHLYRQLVKHTSDDFQRQYGAAVYDDYRQKFLLQYRSILSRNLVVELSADIEDTALDAISGFNAGLVRARLSQFARDLKFASAQIHIISNRLFAWTMIQSGGEALGRVAGYLFWSSRGFQPHLKIFDKQQTWYNHHRAPLFPLSAQYSESTVKAFSAITARFAEVFDELTCIKKDFKQLRRRLYHNAIVAGRTGVLESYAACIRMEMIDFYKAQYKLQGDKRGYEPTSFWKLRSWGYKPSGWYHDAIHGALGKRSFAESHGDHTIDSEAQQSTRRKRRTERQKFRKHLSSPLQVQYYYTNSNWASMRICRYKSIRESQWQTERRLQNLRSELRERRKTALGKMRRILSATLLSYQARTVKNVRSADWLASLPKSERPSRSTQVGKFITALGFYDRPTEENTNIKTNYSRKAEPLKKKSGTQLVRWTVDSNPKSMRVPPQFRPRFTQTPRMRAPHPTGMTFDISTWGQSINALTNADMNGPGNGVGDGCASSLSGGGNEHKSDAEGQRGHSRGEEAPQPPNEQPNEQNPQPPNDNMDKAADEILSSESEQENESESEADEESDMEEAEEQHTPLTYQIPPEALHNALQAPPQTRASYWSQKLYRGPENEELLLHYCSNMEVSERVAKHFLNEKAVGFDIEWKPFGAADSIKENVSLIQIANENRIALFHIARFPGRTAEQLMPPTLKAVLESPDTLKVGVAVKGDCSRLEKYFNLHIQGVFELSRLYNLVEYYATEPSKVSNKLVGLARQVKQHLLLPLYKGEPLADEPQKLGSVRESDWSRPLDYEQIQYAAADAYAGFRLFDILESKRKKLKPTPPIPRVCDYDNKPAPRTAPKTKRAKKTKPETEKIIAEALSGLDAEDGEEEVYETAAEELAEEEEDVDSDSVPESSDENEDLDADYISRCRGRVHLARRSADRSIVSEASAHHIGRVNFSRLTGVDPGYPKLPTLSSQEESSDIFDALDPPPTALLGQRAENRAVMHEVPALPIKPEESDDEFPDPELEDALSSMELDLKSAESVQNPVSSEQPNLDMMDLSAPTKPPQLNQEPPSSIAAPTPTFTPLIQPDSTSHTPEYILATSWAQMYLTSTIPSPSSTATPRIRATIPPLRAYHLWHHQRVPLDTIGAHLRDPPLAQSTVSSYIIQAINMEKLEYRDADLIVLMLTLPANLRLGRYGWLSRKLGIVR